MSLDTHVRTLGRGPGRSRSLTQEEAADAMRLMLSGDAAPEAVGALLMLLRMKSETAEEIAGLAGQAQASLGAMPTADLDWPSYAAGRTRGQPYFLLSAKLLAQSGTRVLIHGWNGADAQVRDGLAAAGISVAQSTDDAARLLDRDIIAYAPLETIHPALFDLLRLRSVLGLRSCINTVCRMLNPCGATASVQGVFHPSYRLLQADAAALLGWQNLSVIKGGGGEFERHPGKDIAAFGLRGGHPWHDVAPNLIDETRRLTSESAPGLGDLWSGTATDAFETEVVLGTAALALATLGHPAPMDHASTLWANRSPCPAL
ncbi:glycosyl transferase family protein [Pseudooceanicola sp. MF1-13]|uniref:glycosyl transferase family protein n=1 Tax=Pseudooceanicola sp. MF1-13 TaxID=3379095 RepID=UPI0038914688